MNQRPYLEHLKDNNDLVTTYEEIRAGFIALSLEKNRQATPHVEQARALKVRASQVTKLKKYKIYMASCAF